jgi:enabled protein
MSIVREAKPSIPGPTAFAGLKKMAGPRKVPPPVPEKSGITGQDPKLAALLAKRKTASEVVEEDAKPAVPAPLARSDSAEARRLAKEDFDKGRKTGWKKDEE